jgi:hypothetical protein
VPGIRSQRTEVSKGARRILAPIDCGYDSVQLCALPPSPELKAVRSLTIREGKGAFGLDEGTNAQRVELYLARARERQKARARVGANTPMTVAAKAPEA